MANDIWTSCYSNQRCAQTDAAHLLLEAHIFQEVRMDQHVEELYLSRQLADGATISSADWDTVKKNAETWCKRNSVRTLVLSG